MVPQLPHYIFLTLKGHSHGKGGEHKNIEIVYGRKSARYEFISSKDHNVPIMEAGLPAVPHTTNFLVTNHLSIFDKN